MDAKITKQRLGNLLSYDWLKIVAAIAAAVTMLTLLFTMLKTRPTIGQKYYIYTFGGLMPANDSQTLADDLRPHLSYDVLEVDVENFTESTGLSMLQNRRAVLDGTALFVSDYSEPDENGDPMPSKFDIICSNGLLYTGTMNERLGLFYDLPTYFSDCEEYLIRFFGENWREGTIDEEEARACFFARNGKDKRFKTDEEKEEGVRLECERLEVLRADYLYVLENGFEYGVGNEASTLTFTTYESEGYESAEGHVDCSYPVGVCLGKLAGVRKLYYYSDENGERRADKLNLLFFDNGDYAKDSKFESVSVLRYLLEAYKI